MRNLWAGIGVWLLLAAPALAAETAMTLLEVDARVPVEAPWDPARQAAATAELLTQPRAPAPAISQVAVVAVYSTQAGEWEYMTSLGQAATVKDHGGASMRVAVRQIGYGGAPIASVWGTALPASARYQSDRLCVSGGNYTTTCLPGQSIVGWMYYFNLDGHHDGRFGFQNTSLNAPFNTATTSINIR